MVSSIINDKATIKRGLSDDDKKKVLSVLYYYDVRYYHSYYYITLPGLQFK